MATDALRVATERYRQRAADLDEARAELHRQVRAALAAGMSKSEVARITGLSRESVYAINRAV